MAWKIVAGTRPPEPKPGKASELPYPPPITPDRSGKSKPAKSK